jgi:hypothetical protein
MDGAIVRTAVVWATQVWAQSMFVHWHWCSCVDSLIGRLVRIVAGH